MGGDKPRRYISILPEVQGRGLSPPTMAQTPKNLNKAIEMNKAEPPNGEIVNVATHLTRMAREQPYKRAVVYPAGRDKNKRVTYAHLTFRQLEHEVDRLAYGSPHPTHERKYTSNAEHHRTQFESEDCSTSRWRQRPAVPAGKDPC